MYKLPDDASLASMISQTVVMVCCSANQVIFHLSAGSAIVVETDFEHFDGGSVSRRLAVPLSDPSILTLIEQQVAEVKALRDRRDLLVIFTNGHSLKFTSSDEYESFHLKLEDTTYPI